MISQASVVPPLLLLLCLCQLLISPIVLCDIQTSRIKEVSSLKEFASSSSRHTNNWAILVGTSKYWFNYRHIANTLSMYRSVKRLGIPDSNIILMLADDIACNPRNIYPGQVFNHVDKVLNLYGENIEVDYRGNEVTIENFLRMLTGRFDEDVPRSKRLLTDDRSNIFIYMSGHGGDEFLKFLDAEEISSQDLADAFQQMWQKRRYNEIFFMIDTCQANTMYSKFYSPNILACGSSEKGEVSYSHHTDNSLGISVVDRFTYYTLDFLEHVQPSSNKTISELFSSYSYSTLQSTFGYRSDLFHRDIKNVKLTDFFGNVQPIEVLQNISTTKFTTVTTDGSNKKLLSEIKTEKEEENKGETESLNLENWNRHFEKRRLSNEKTAGDFLPHPNFYFVSHAVVIVLCLASIRFVYQLLF